MASLRHFLEAVIYCFILLIHLHNNQPRTGLEVGGGGGPDFPPCPDLMWQDHASCTGFGALTVWARHRRNGCGAYRMLRYECGYHYPLNFKCRYWCFRADVSNDLGRERMAATLARWQKSGSYGSQTLSFWETVLLRLFVVQETHGSNIHLR